MTIRLRSCLTAAIATAGALALVAPGSATAETASQVGPGAAAIKSHAADSILAKARATKTDKAAPRADRSKVTPKESLTKARTQEKLTGDRVDGTLSLTAAGDQAAVCDDLALDITSTADQNWLHWTSTGAASYTIQRQRERGAWQTLGTASSSATSFLDRTTNPDAAYTYRVSVSGTTCALPAGTSATGDGWGEPDAIYGGAGADDALMAQDTWTFAMPTGGHGFNPAFAPDGRRVAAARTTDAGVTWSLAISDPSRRYAGEQSIASPADTVALEPSWSPDGRYVAYTRYEIAEDGTVNNPALRVFDTRTSADRAVAGSEGLIQSDWRSASTLVAAGGAVGEGLFTIPVGGGTSAAVPGTQNAGSPEVGPDGRIWFIAGDGTNYHLNVMTPGQAPVAVRSSTTSWFNQPRTTANGEVFYQETYENDPADPNDSTFSIIALGADQSSRETAIGAPNDESLLGFSGYDVRVPKSKGSSDLIGDANPDILARDKYGTLWAYPATDDAFAGPRIKIGTGWQIYNAFIVAGDLTGDDKAEIIARDKDGRLWRYDGLGNGKIRARVQIGTGWGAFTPISTGDFNGDHRADLVVKQSNGDLWLYRGRGDGTVGDRVRLGTGWNIMNAVVGVGDFDLDNDADLIAREASTAKLWLYPGNGKGGLSPRRQVGAGWNIFNGLAGPEMLGPNTWVYARGTDGTVVAYMVVGDGKFDGNEVYHVGTGWNSYGFAS